MTEGKKSLIVIRLFLLLVLSVGGWSLVRLVFFNAVPGYQNTPQWRFVIAPFLFVVLLFVLFGGLFGREHKKDRDINGEIEGRLQGYCDQRTRLIYQARMGCPVDEKIQAVDQAETEFRNTIQYGVVTDGSENYWSYK